MMQARTLLLILLGLALAAAVAWARRDYNSWVALGPGGLPHTLGGWLTTVQNRLTQIDPRDPAGLAPEVGRADDVALLGELPSRNGGLPEIAKWPIPHRQLDQFASTGMRKQLEASFDEAVRRHADTLHVKLSVFERHNPAIFLRDPRCGHRHVSYGQGETAHIHPSDGSMHMILSAKDAMRVIDAGWGERHPMAGVMARVPFTYIFVYPPRDEFELKVVEQLLEASILHMLKAPKAALPADAAASAPQAPSPRRC